MRIIFIRHGDPDYANDALTEKGIREAKLLSDRIVKWPTEQIDFYCSPLGRAQKTAAYSLDRIGRSAATYDWMKEFTYKIEDPTTGRFGVPWDFMPEYWTEIPQMYDKDEWKKTDIYRSNPELLPAYENVCEGLDSLLEKYGYKRHHNYYISTNESKQIEGAQHDIIVIFCHLGITCVMMSHLLNISPVQLLHGLYIAPTSVSVLSTEERKDNIAYFRAQAIGDTAHLIQGSESISASGYFTEPFHG